MSLSELETAIEDLVQAQQRITELEGKLASHMSIAEQSADRVRLLNDLVKAQREHIDDLRSTIGILERRK